MDNDDTGPATRPAAYPQDAAPSNGSAPGERKNLRDLPRAVLLPRDKLIRFGASGLSQTELLAVLLGTGTKGRSVLRVAEDLVGRHGGAGLAALTLDEW